MIPITVDRLQEFIDNAVGVERIRYNVTERYKYQFKRILFALSPILLTYNLAVCSLWPHVDTALLIPGALIFSLISAVLLFVYRSANARKRIVEAVYSIVRENSPSIVVKYIGRIHHNSLIELIENHENEIQLYYDKKPYGHDVIYIYDKARHIPVRKY